LQRRPFAAALRVQEFEMANMNENPDAEARKWFTIALIGALLYVGTVFTFVINGDLDGDNSAQEMPRHEQSH
jgi:hypothetical protein